MGCHHMLIVGDACTGKSFWIKGNLEHIQSPQWFDVDRIFIWNGLRDSNAIERVESSSCVFVLSGSIQQEFGITPAVSLGSRDLVIFDHLADDHWDELLQVLPILRERHISTVTITQMDADHIDRMASVFDHCDRWLFFRHDQRSAEIYKTDKLKAVCPLQPHFISLIQDIPLCEYRSIQL